MGTPRLSADGTKLLTATEKRVRLYNATTGRMLREFPCDDLVSAATMSPDASEVATIDGMLGAVVTFWDAVTRQPVCRVPIKDTVEHVILSPNRTDMLVAEYRGDRIYHVLDVRNGTALFPAIQPQFDMDLRTSPGCLPVRLSPDGKRLVVLNSRWFTMYDARSRKRLAKARTDGDPHREGWLQDVRFTADGKRLVSVAGSIQVWDALTLKPLAKPLRVKTHGWAWALSPEGNRVAGVLEGGDGGLWDLTSGQKLLAFDTEINGTFAFSLDGKCLAAAIEGSTATDSHTTLWRLPPAGSHG